MSGLIKVKLVHSAIGRSQKQKDTIRSLGLRKLHQERLLKDLPSIRGMIQKVLHLVEFELEAKELPKTKKSNLTYKIAN